MIFSQKKVKDYILNIIEQPVLEYLYDKYLLEPLIVHTETESFDTQELLKKQETLDFL